ncbi:MAG TPA: hypothetical protein VNM66_02095 [Thermodesulfobacteriota bacterium]|nr:hypothetical protein [Thermodesulfobacteriota bacterium]
MPRRIDPADVVYEVGRLDLPGDNADSRLDPIFEVTAADVAALTAELPEPDCALTLEELEAALAAVQRTLGRR